MTTRRSFLELIAGAFAIRPGDVATAIEIMREPRPPAPPPRGKNPIIPNWWQRWTIADTVDVQPGGAEVSEILFSAPIPHHMIVESLRWITEPEISLANLTAILDKLECRLSVDGRPLFAAPMHLLGRVGAPSALYEPNNTPFYPAIAPREDLRLEVIGAPAVDKLTRVMFALDGTVKIY